MCDIEIRKDDLPSEQVALIKEPILFPLVPIIEGNSPIREHT